jgi:hypothetical protein
VNPWHELGLSEGASEQEIRRAYRRLAAEHHPDKNPGDEQAAVRFQRVCDAYAALQKGAQPAAEYGIPDFGSEAPYSGPWPGGQERSGVHFRFNAPPEMRAMIERLRRVFLLALLSGLAAVVAFGHTLRGLAWSELLYPHQLLLSFGAGLMTSIAAFFAWFLSIGLFGFRWGTAAFWLVILLQVMR